jgi:hypothetical protein
VLTINFLIIALADTLGVPIPNTVILPSAEHPTDTTGKSFRNLKYPMDWEGYFRLCWFSCLYETLCWWWMEKCISIENKEEFWEKHRETGQLVMMLQEEIVFTEYFRVYCLGCKAVRIMQYEPRNPTRICDMYLTDRQ